MIIHRFNPKIVSAAQHTFVEQLMNCKDFSKSSRLLGASKGRGTAWFLNTFAEFGVDSVLRHYYRGGLFGKFVKDHYWFRSEKHTRSAQEFTLLEQLHSWGMPVPRPIALRIERRFCCYQADILLEKIANTQDLSQFLQHQPLDEAQYRTLGRLIRRLHDHQVHHADLNIHNILLNTLDGSFWLIDFDKCRIQEGNSWKQENLARLYRSFCKEQGRLAIRFCPQDWEALIQGYSLSA